LQSLIHRNRKEISDMMRLKRTVLALAPVLGVALAGPVIAQDTRGTAADPSSRSATPANAPRAQASMNEMRGSRLVGKNVQDTQGKNIGEIKDVIVDATNGRVHYAVLGFDPGWFKSEKLYAFPLSQFRPGDDRGDRLVLNVTKERLQNAPGFQDDKWPDWNRADARGAIDQYHGTRAGAEAANARFVRLSKLLDADVETANGDDVGDVEDVVVNLQTGQVRYAVIDFDPGFFKAEKLVALPMGAFQAAKDDDDLIVKVDKAKLANAPAFDRNRWPENDRAFNSGFDRWSRDAGYGVGPTAGRAEDMNRPTTGTARGAAPASEAGSTTRTQ
jgi:sporulation protein YlmC with PRC-barrel domain